MEETFKNQQGIGYKESAILGEFIYIIQPFKLKCVYLILNCNSWNENKIPTVVAFLTTFYGKYKVNSINFSKIA